VKSSGTIAIAGAGAFGTALALIAAKAGHRVNLWTQTVTQADAMQAARENKRHLPGVTLPPPITVTSEKETFRDAGLVLLAAPAQATRSLAVVLRNYIPSGVPVVACAKGIERGRGRLQTEIIAELLPHANPAVLSGPGFAEEIAGGLPTAVAIAAVELALAHELCAALSTDTFRPYASDDPVGVELGGAVKNVLAIAAGVVAGRKLGESARAALIARGLAEMMRLGSALGARPETFMGLSGLGDLVLTATSNRSRNLAFGMALGAGRSTAELLGEDQPLAEGAYTAGVAAELARQHGIDAPIIAAVAAVIDGRIGVAAAIEGLVSRPLKAENA
jgi:glycerol-3-phosphate dehydrogenase (NAD(P)+)